MDDIKLVNHACFSFSVEGSGCLVDPWLEGPIFNQAWRLVSEGGEIPDNLKYIFISHEHPDHLHWPTLKKLSSSEVTVVMTTRSNPNVQDNLERLGYKVITVPSGHQKELGPLKVEFYKRGHDSTIVFQHGDFVMVNQNDCHLTPAQVRAIKSLYPTIDIWWMQFSLAGYYGNLDDTEALQAANKKHRDMFKDYKSKFNPRVAIPFASFVYFCREENRGLNQYRVKLQQILDENDNVQVLFKGDEYLVDGYEDRNKLNVEKWESLFESDLVLEKPHAGLRDLKDNFKMFCDKHPVSGEVEFSLFEGGACMLDFANKTTHFRSECSNPVAKVSMFDLSEMFKNPWGADTMNITSCFHVYNSTVWRGLLGGMDSLYAR